MSEKHLTEPAWKALATKQKLKTPKLEKALADLVKCDAADPEAKLKALLVLEKEVETLKKEQKANKEVTEYLGEILKEVGKSRTAAELLKKTGKADDKKDAAKKEEEEVEVEVEEEGGDIKSALSGAMRKVKARQVGDPPIEAMVCQMGKSFGVLLGKKVGAGQQKVLKDILKGSGHKFAKGTCEWGKGDIYTFVLESSLSGAAKGMKEFFKEHTGNNYKLRVGSGAVMEEDLTEEKAPEAPTPAPVTADPAAAFKKRLETLLPKIKAALAAKHPKAQELTAKTQGAGAAAKTGDYVEANKSLDAVEALLSGAAVPAPKPPEAKSAVPPTAGAPTLSTYVKAKRDWKAAKAAAEKNIAALKAAILQQCNPELEVPVRARINVWDGIFTIVDDNAILPVIEQAIKEPDEERQAERNKTLAASFSKMLAALRQHPLVSVADSNPFGKFAIRGPLETMLTSLGTAFGH